MRLGLAACVTILACLPASAQIVGTWSTKADECEFGKKGDVLVIEQNKLYQGEWGCNIIGGFRNPNKWVVRGQCYAENGIDKEVEEKNGKKVPDTQIELENTGGVLKLTVIDQEVSEYFAIKCDR
jgi:hypothetical protein